MSKVSYSLNNDRSVECEVLEVRLERQVIVNCFDIVGQDLPVDNGRRGTGCIAFAHIAVIGALSYLLLP